MEGVGEGKDLVLSLACSFRLLGVFERAVSVIGAKITRMKSHPPSSLWLTIHPKHFDWQI